MGDPARSPTRTEVFSSDRGRLILAVAGVLLVASCLRPAITSVGPVLHRIGDATGLGSGALGLLGSLPLLAFAAVSPVAHLVARRLGLDRTVLVALVVLIVGIILRSTPAAGWGQIVVLFAGTLLLGAGVAVGNVLVPAVVKRDFPTQVPRMTGAYTSTMNTFAAVASGVSVPIAVWVVSSEGVGWRVSIGIWALPALIAVVVWLARMRLPHRAVAIVRPRIGSDHETGADHDHRPSMWSSALAWQVTIHMGVQSTVFYTLLIWLPSIEAEQQISEGVAGTHLFLYQAAGIAAVLTVTAVMGRLVDQQRIAVMITIPMIIALIGMITAPGAIVLWVMLAGLTSGSSLAVALALIGLRSRDATDTARLSGMAQSMGYLLAAGGPLAAGAVSGVSGSWVPVIVMLIMLTLTQAVMGWLAGRPRVVGERPVTR